MRRLSTDTVVIRKQAARFWAKATPEPNSGCWLWTASLRPNGYGMFGIAAGSVQSAHRVAWELVNGPIPDGLHVLHRCDVRACVNPSHLFLGTRFDNMQDMIAKGRWKPWNRDKTKCIRGHEFSAENTRTGSHGNRVCIQCERSRWRNARRVERWRHVP
jgi:hypothetical protein